MFSFVNFKKMTIVAAGLALSFGFASHNAAAASINAGSPFMSTGNVTSQPIGHYEFCKRLPDECNVTFQKTAPLKLDQAIWSKIIQVNASVNQRIEPVTDLELYGQEEYWDYPANAGAGVGAGDCEDYALLKRRELAQAGVPLSSLLITVVRKPDGEGHAVLTVRTDRGDFILDNLEESVKNWQETDYTYLKRQAANHTGRWVSIDAPANLVVGAVK